jgi:hypothetical protein
MTNDVPEIFSGIVDMDEPNPGGQWKNKRKTIRDRGTNRGQGTRKQPVSGIFCCNGAMWAEIVDDDDDRILQPLIFKKVSTGSVGDPDTWES